MNIIKLRQSLSARRAWIEIETPKEQAGKRAQVALRKESVDRNIMQIVIVIGCVVALRKESVDRNQSGRNSQNIKRVALRKESVDRNLHYRRVNLLRFQVALRKESVDRNLAVWAIEHAYQLSLSVRRAWIEITPRALALQKASRRSP